MKFAGRDGGSSGVIEAAGLDSLVVGFGDSID